MSYQHQSIFTPNLSAEPTLVLGTQFNTLLLDGFLVTNKEASPLSLSVYVLREIENAPHEIYVIKNKVMQPFETANILMGVPFYMQSGDTLFTTSWYTTDRYDCLISYRQESSTPTG